MTISKTLVQLTTIFPIIHLSKNNGMQIVSVYSLKSHHKYFIKLYILHFVVRNIIETSTYCGLRFSIHKIPACNHLFVYWLNCKWLYNIDRVPDTFVNVRMETFSTLLWYTLYDVMTISRVPYFWCKLTMYLSKEFLSRLFERAIWLIHFHWPLSMK